jgi:hypothetical protein
MKPGNPLLYCRKGANSGGAFRKMRGMSDNAKTPERQGSFCTLYILPALCW